MRKKLISRSEKIKRTGYIITQHTKKMERCSKKRLSKRSKDRGTALRVKTNFLEIKKGITSGNKNDFFSIGSEETGHCITEGYLSLKNEEEVPVFFGNGVKSAINTFVATQILLGSKSTRSYFSNLTHPFRSGYKQTFYTYYVNKNLFHKKSQLWDLLKVSIFQEALSKGFSPRLTNFSEEPDMLYVSLDIKKK